MLDKLLACKNLDDFTNFAVSLLTPADYQCLQQDIVSKGIMFSSDDYWSLDMILRSTKTAKTLVTAVAQVSKEDLAKQVLHRLQLVDKCCPAASALVKRLLEKTTC